MRAALAVMLLWAAAAAAEEARELTCRTAAGDEFVLSLWGPSDLGVPLHCIEPSVIDGARACSPDGGFGLGDAEGGFRVETEAAGIEHNGTWFFAQVGPTQFVASASQGTRVPLTLEIAGETFWRIVLTLATGEGTIHTSAGPMPFTCREP